MTRIDNYAITAKGPIESWEFGGNSLIVRRLCQTVARGSYWPALVAAKAHSGPEDTVIVEATPEAYDTPNNLVVLYQPTF